MPLRFRPCDTEEGYWLARSFLRNVLALNGHLERSWHVARLDYALWHGCLNCARVSLDKLSILCQSKDEIVALLVAEGGYGDVHISVHPANRTLEHERAFLNVAEDRLASRIEEHGRRLVVWVPEVDGLRREAVRERGYRLLPGAEHQWRCDLGSEAPDCSPPPGYTIRSLGDGLELLERCYASGLGFHDGDIQIAVENRVDPTWYRNIQSAPLYRRDLDLVACAADGSIAAFCTCWFDDVTRTAYIEPVATVPAHQRRGLGRALLMEGLRRLRHVGARRAFVGGHSHAANALYRSVMGEEHEVYEPWVREWRVEA